MDFVANKVLVEIIGEGAFWITYFMERIWSVGKYWSEVLLFRILWC